MPRSQTPAGPRRLAWRRSGAAADRRTSTAPATDSVSRLNDAAPMLPVYASQPGLPPRHATLGSRLVASLCRAGFACWDPLKVSIHYVMDVLLLQASPGALDVENASISERPEVTNGLRPFGLMTPLATLLAGVGCRPLGTPRGSLTVTHHTHPPCARMLATSQRFSRRAPKRVSPARVRLRAQAIEFTHRACHHSRHQRLRPHEGLASPAVPGILRRDGSDRQPHSEAGPCHPPTSACA